MVFQKPNPFPMSIYDNIAYGPRTHGVTQPREARRDRRTFPARRGHLGRGQGPAEKERPRPLRRPAAAALHRPGAGRRAGGAADGRADERARPHLHLEDRGAGDGARRKNTPSSSSRTTCSRPCASPTTRRSSCWASWWSTASTEQMFSQPRGQAHRGLYHGEVWMMRSRFDEQLAQLNQRADRDGRAVRRGDRAWPPRRWRTATCELARSRSRRWTRRSTRRSADIESLCLKLLLQQQPVARDLRQISAALKMITDMERIGDQAEDIAEIVTLPGRPRRRRTANSCAKWPAPR